MALVLAARSVDCKFCSFIAPSGLAQRWDLGGEKGMLSRGAPGLWFGG